MTYEGYSRLTNKNAHMHESERVHNFHVRIFRFFCRSVFYFIDSSECNDVMLRIPVFFFSGGFIKLGYAIRNIKCATDASKCQSND